MDILELNQQRRTLRAGRLTTVSLLLLICLQVLNLPAALSDKDEFEVKAECLYLFTKHVRWPATAFTNDEAPLVIGVLGEDPFGAKLDKAVQGRLSQGRRVTIRRARRVEEVSDCHVVFLSSSEKRKLPEVLNQLRMTNALTVCEEESFFEKGVQVKLMLVDERLRFDVNREAIEKAGLKIGSDMLDVVKRWKDERAKR